jgi:outer membrane murein-binding lipoprotein Lpp
VNTSATPSNLVTANNTLFRYVGPPFEDDEEDVDKDSTAEIIRLLREAENRSRSSVTHGDLQALGTTVMEAIRDVGGRIDTLAATQNNQAVVLDQVSRRVTIVERVLGVNPKTGSLAPRRMTPNPMPAFDPDKTDGGRRIIPAEKWNEIETTLQEHAVALEQVQSDLDAERAEKQKAEAAERRAQERQADIAEYATKLEAESKKTKKRVKKIITGLIAVGPIIGGMVHYILTYLTK